MADYCAIYMWCKARGSSQAPKLSHPRGAPSRVETLREIAKSANTELGAGEEERKRKENKRGEEEHRV